MTKDERNLLIGEMEKLDYGFWGGVRPSFTKLEDGSDLCFANWDQVKQYVEERK